MKLTAPLGGRDGDVGSSRGRLARIRAPAAQLIRGVGQATSVKEKMHRAARNGAVTLLAAAAALCLVAVPLYPGEAKAPTGRVSTLLAFVHDTVAYLGALAMEYRWTAARPTTKAELEQHLWFYSEHTISPSSSSWGWDHRLKDGERMVQYLILGQAPLDVVYDSKDRLQAIYTSYE
jgi:hypothetical protein